MAYTVTTATKRIAKLKKRIRIIQGGTSAGKTIGILEVLIHLAQTDKEPKLTSVVSESFPHLRRGAMRDFLDILETQKYFKKDHWSRTDFTYTFETGSKIEFFSADQPGKVRGPRRDRLFVNEANNISFENFEQMEIRTNETIFLDYNPVSEFWAHDHLKNREDADFIVLTYKDNESLAKEIVKTIESRKERRNWWLVYGLGQLSELEGRIYTGWQMIDRIPEGARLERYGLDFGYTNDPTAIVGIYFHNNQWIFDEKCYKKGMSNREIAETFKSLVDRLIIADSAEPKSIDELRSYGLNVLPADKGRDSVRNGIQLVQDQPIAVTKRSLNLIKEYRNYMWRTDKEGRVMNMPEDFADHCMDALRYALSTLGKLQQAKDYWDRIYEVDLNPIVHKLLPNRAL